jgi:GT2 family glycosyltransferase
MNPKIHLIIVSWKQPNILIPCIDSILDSKTDLTAITCVLNEGCEKSAQHLTRNGINFISTNKNFGAQAVDFATRIFNAEYTFFSNDDMIFPPEWENEMLEEINSDQNCSVSMPLVEPAWYGHPLAIGDKLVENIDLEFDKIQNFFWKKWSEKAYSFPNLVTWNHPIMVKTKDWHTVGGYSDNFNMEFWPGHWTDDYFAFRLFRFYDGNFKFKHTKKACVYHAQSKGMIKNPHRVPESVFTKFTGLSANEFKKLAHQYEPA